MSETKVINLILSALLIMTVTLFAWTCFYLNDISVQIQSKTTVAAFNG